jgi:hypothetical protein
VSGISPGLAAFKLACQISPIILVGGIANITSFGMLPIIALTEGGGVLGSLASGNVLSSVSSGLTTLVGAATAIAGGGPASLDDFFANFQPLAGSTLIDNQYGTYPLASQQVAANAVIVQPLRVSLAMLIPVRQSFGYANKTATMMALQASLSAHVTQGGTFTVVTPTYIYTNCLLLSLRDISGGATKQSQYEWAWDFMQPLLTINQIQQAQNSLMNQISTAGGGSASPAWSGAGTTVGSPPSGFGSPGLPGGAAGQGITSSPLPPVSQ